MGYNSCGNGASRERNLVKSVEVHTSYRTDLVRIDGKVMYWDDDLCCYCEGYGMFEQTPTPGYPTWVVAEEFEENDVLQAMVSSHVPL
jgi:hypothetical protein